MPRLINGISANVLDNFIGEVILTQQPIGEVGQGDYIEIAGITAFLQDWSKTESTEEFPKLTTYGLKQKTDFTELIISY